MNVPASPLAIVIFFAFVGLTLGLSFYLGRRAKDASGYFAAHGQIPWFVNGVAFAGDYLSAASFLGICGMIGFYGYDGFLYSIGFLAGWVVALFVIAEPMKRLGKFTFADALNARFQSPGIQLVAGISTLVVSVFYLIPQMVGAGTLVTPLLGLSHALGVIMVGAVVMMIVVTAGMVSTTWVQFLKGSLLVIFSAILTVMILVRGFDANDESEIAVVRVLGSQTVAQALQERGFTDATKASHPTSDQDYWFAQNADDHQILFIDTQLDDKRLLLQCQYKVDNGGGYVVINGVSPPKDPADPQPNFLPVGHVTQLPDNVKKTGPVGPIEFFRTLRDSRVMLWSKLKSPPTFPADVVADDGSVVVYQPRIVDGTRVLRPGEHPKFAGIRNEAFWPRMNFLSLMIALFCGTASLPHILIRYYTVKDGAAARKSTIVGIATIGFFYVLTLYLGLGAMTSGSMDVTNSNMTAPLLARSIGEWMFAIISAIAFTTVLGTVSGLILASAGAVSHDILKNFVGMKMEDDLAVRIAKIASVIVGSIAICLGILFENMNVGYLVGWAFSVAASSNLPALVMLLFWRGTTRQGIIAGMLVGMISSLGWILLSSDTFNSVYNVSRPEILDTLIPFSQPGIVTIPLSFLVLIGVSLMTREKQPAANG